MIQSHAPMVFYSPCELKVLWLIADKLQWYSSDTKLIIKRIHHDSKGNTLRNIGVIWHIQTDVKN